MLFWDIAIQTFDILWNIENKPYLKYLRAVTSPDVYTSPFTDNNTSNTPQYQEVIIPCLYNENDELTVSNINIVTRKQFYLFVKEGDLSSNGIRQPSLADKIVFPVDQDGNELSYNMRPNRYSIKGISYVFGLWKLRVDKETI